MSRALVAPLALLIWLVLALAIGGTVAPEHVELPTRCTSDASGGAICGPVVQR